MEEFKMEDLRTYLQSVRGETRVKVKEEGIRNTFLQKAMEAIFREHDWPFNEKTTTLTTFEDGVGWEAPADFSPMNGFTIVDGQTKYGRLKARYTMDQTTGKLYFTNLSSTAPVLTYHIKAPDLVNDVDAVAYFPDPMLIAERGYVRLKTAYFPDEDSDKELALSKRQVRELYKEMVPKRDFQHWTWG